MVYLSPDWFTYGEAAEYFGYTNPESLKERIRSLRSKGMVVDLGAPPKKYKVAKVIAKDKLVLYWLNSRANLIKRDVPQGLLDPRRGNRARKLKSK